MLPTYLSRQQGCFFGQNFTKCLFLYLFQSDEYFISLGFLSHHILKKKSSKKKLNQNLDKFYPEFQQVTKYMEGR
jgi:hypothetical protein